MTVPTTKRLRDLGDGAGPASRLGRLVRAIQAPPSLSREARARILRELRRRDDGPSPWSRRWLTLAVGVAGLLLFAAGAKALVAGAVARRPVRQIEHPSIRVAGVRAVPRPSVVSRKLESQLPAPVDQVPPPAVRAAAPAQPSVEEPVSPVGEESRMLARAIQKLRQEHDARGALVILDRYRARFPGGVLGAEAILVRLDALTSIGDVRSALATLDGLDISGARAAELWVARGELRSAEGRCREAIGDFDRALARRSAKEWQDRALRGRAACLRQLGQAAGR